MAKKKKSKAGRPATGRLRPILPRTSVAPETLAYIKAQKPKPAGRVIDDAVAALKAKKNPAKPTP